MRTNDVEAVLDGIDGRHKRLMGRLRAWAKQIKNDTRQKVKNDYQDGMRGAELTFVKELEKIIKEFSS